MFRFSFSLILCVFVSCNNKKEPTKVFPEEPLGLFWEYEYYEKGWGTTAQPAIIGDSLLLITGDEYISSLIIKNGDILWKYVVPGNTASNIFNFHFDEQNIYGWQYSGKNKIFALNISNGEEIWSVDSMGYFRYHGLSPNFYYSPFGNKFFKITLSGEVIDTLKNSHTFRSVTYYDNNVYGGQYWWSDAYTKGRIICYDEKTLDSLWSYDAPGGGFNLCYPIFENEVLYVGTVWGNNNKAIALNAETGEELWSTPMRCYAMLLEGDVLYVTETHWVHALDKFTGEILWSSELFFSTDEQHSMGYLDGYIYVDHYGLLYILDAATGEIVEEMQGPDNAPVVMVTAGKDKIIVQSTQHVYCFEPYGSN